LPCVFYRAAMKLLLPLITLTLLFSSCTHQITRVGYTLPATTGIDCKTTIVYGQSEDIDSSAQLLGKIKLGDTGVSSACNEADALSILTKEACALNANLALITDYALPSLASTCYRCSASFTKSLQHK
jgi:hypothetical protein